VAAGACVAPVDITHDSASPASTATIRVLDLAAHPGAVCNDGTPGYYTVRAGVGKGIKRWQIYLEGGGQCSTSSECQIRYVTQKALMSSKGIVNGTIIPSDVEGIKSIAASVDPDFYDANLVQIHYCSSDTWSGDRAGNDALSTGNVGRWHFRGRRIVKAVLADLAALGLQAAEEVLLVGSSAGGIGVFNHADDVRAALPSARVVALSDAGFMIDYPSYDPVTKMESTAVPTEVRQYLGAALAVWGGRGDKSCEDAATDADAHILCRSPADLLLGGHVTTPLFVRQSQLDLVQLKRLIAPSEMDTAAKAYRERFAGQMRKLLGQLGPSYAVFSPHDNKHGVVADDAAWSAAGLDGTSLPAAVGAWYRDPCTASVKRIEVP
jgi:hypothetical protein